MNKKLEEQVWARAGGACEYCRLLKAHDPMPFQIDHVIAMKHGGLTIEGNLALSCFSCNSHKGPNIAGIDPQSGDLVRLYHPRQDDWTEHFSWHGPEIMGTTPIGRVTIQVLAMNRPELIELRRLLILAGVTAHAI